VFDKGHPWLHSKNLASKQKEQEIGGGRRKEEKEMV
jgi:hypothetical protein